MTFTWQAWQELQRRHIAAQQAELDSPADFTDEQDRRDLYAQPCPVCARRGTWTRTAREVSFTGCGHSFPIPAKPQTPEPEQRRPRGPAAHLADHDTRTGAIHFADGTMLAIRQAAWTNFPERGQYGEERWQLTTTVAKDAYVPEGTAALTRVDIAGQPFATDAAVVEVADPDAERPVITIQWRPADRRNLPPATP
ncbi:hypothetical protein AN218_02130 [Streptomyces nanshensis]|uniref:Uncharacterized protein n=1 Tax=Streptomyces nanshensis TaxID=518642 RepID=A0A1E7LC54_9ACTN|nr:hypothetical protein AN218_02130 [Streptomyces nanshensis]